jgi:hypothetical protein
MVTSIYVEQNACPLVNDIPQAGSSGGNRSGPLTRIARQILTATADKATLTRHFRDLQPSSPW